MKLEEGEWKRGEWIPNPNLMRNNPKGYNKHKKNKDKVIKIPKKKTKEELIKELGDVFHKQWKMKNEVLSLGHRIKEINEELTSR